MITIIISGMSCVGKTTVAKALAKRFDLRYLSGGDMLKEIAIEMGYRSSGDDWWDTPEGMKFLNERKKDPSFDKKVDERLIQYAQKGGVVISSYPLPWLTDKGIKIWLKGSIERRAERMAQRDNITIEEARRIVLIRDDENKRLYNQLYNIRFGDDLSVFDFVINTDNLSKEQVIDITYNIVKHFVWKV
ncbi:MAG: cytidylate kinase family protein [Nitrososphaerota archaeon]|nr:cytidylate kinase family protein [Nitrososphaerales archaeon]MCX8191953.1 cytidylate kinase family protein [Nitrososphaerales archaeon]MDW8044278.1 cytidylate kinase family protein [Nitrososphaerota archaeon]